MRNFLRLSLRITIFCKLLFNTSYLAQAASPSLPNIVIIYADDMGYGDLAIQNPESKIPTPNLDELAKQGMLFTDAHSSSGVCSPSRYALLTGRYHWRAFHGINNFLENDVMIEHERLTLPEMLKEKGYATACVGKWHLGWNWDAIKKPGINPVKYKAGKREKKLYRPEYFDWDKAIPGGPTSHGFDYYFGDDVINFPPYTWFENDKVIIAPTEMWTKEIYSSERERMPYAESADSKGAFRPGPMAADWDRFKVLPKLTEKAVEWIGKQKDSGKPFFLYYPLPSPHKPEIPTKEYWGKTKAGAYGDFMFMTDDMVGKILAAIEENGFADNTLIIFTSDNGPEKNAFERARDHKHFSMRELRGLKRDIWEGGHRVPFIVKWKGVVKEASVNDALISQTDLMRTIARIVAYELPEDAAPDSFDQFENFKNVNKRIRDFQIHNTRKDQYALRKDEGEDKWLLINHRTGSMSKMPDFFKKLRAYEDFKGKYALYNLKDDLEQRKNLATEMPNKVKELQDLLGRVRSE